jgi:hypothetical protein
VVASAKNKLVCGMLDRDSATNKLAYGVQIVSQVRGLRRRRQFFRINREHFK